MQIYLPKACFACATIAANAGLSLATMASLVPVDSPVISPVMNGQTMTSSADGIRIQT